MEEVQSLLTDPGRQGWRTHRRGWRHRVAALLATQPANPEAWRLLAGAITDVRLLRPALACALPLPGSAVLWRDAQHRVLGSAGRPVDAVWLGALVLWLRRHRGRLVDRHLVALRRGAPQQDVLRFARSDASWHPTAVTVPPGVQEMWRTRVTLVCLLLEPQPSDPIVEDTRQWLRDRSVAHLTPSLRMLWEHQRC